MIRRQPAYFIRARGYMPTIEAECMTAISTCETKPKENAWQYRGVHVCADAGVWFAEVDEAFSTQTCSVCNSRAGPKGRQGLGMRGWQCTVCGAIHDRDVNAAHNILAAGHRRLAEGILVP